MIKNCVIGHPIAHSKSPLIHNYWIKKHGLDGLYDKHDINADNLSIGIQQLIVDGYTGFNITVPHKQAIISLCSDIDDIARSIGAVNTVLVESGELFGRNTDAFGFIENIRQNAPNFDFTKKAAFVIGAGGAARAITYGLLQAGTPEIHLTNRSKDKALNLQKMAPDRIHIIEWEERGKSLDNYGLFVNTTSLGMKGQPPLEFSLKGQAEKALVCDIVYVPLMTDFLTQAKAQGHEVVTGIGMLLHQARPAFKGWFGIMPEVDDELQNLVLAV